MMKMQFILLILFMILATHVVEAAKSNSDDRKTESYKAERDIFNQRKTVDKSRYAVQRFTVNAKSIYDVSMKKWSKQGKIDKRQNNDQFNRLRRKLLANIDSASHNPDILRRMKQPLEKFLKKYPKDANTWKYLIGVCDYYLKNYKQAVKKIKASIKKNKNVQHPKAKNKNVQHPKTNDSEY